MEAILLTDPSKLISMLQEIQSELIAVREEREQFKQLLQNAHSNKTESPKFVSLKVFGQRFVRPNGKQYSERSIKGMFKYIGEAVKELPTGIVIDEKLALDLLNKRAPGRVQAAKRRLGVKTGEA